MRAILSYTVYSQTDHIMEQVLKSIGEYGWTKPDLGLSREDLVGLAAEVIGAAEKAKRDLPTSPESQFIQDAINKRFKLTPGSRDSSEPGRAQGATHRFAMFNYERNALEQAILILTQIPREDRSDAFAQEMAVVGGPEFSVYGVVFAGTSQASASSLTMQARLRSNDLATLQTATSSFVSALNPGAQTAGVRRYTSRAASIGRQRVVGPSFESDLQRIAIRSVTNELLFQGRAIPIRSRFSLLRHTLSDHSAKLLGGLSLLLLGLSALLYAFFPEEGWWLWTEQSVGRLATGAFGALLVDSALDYTALRRSITGGTGTVTHGAVIDWSRV